MAGSREMASTTKKTGGTKTGLTDGFAEANKLYIDIHHINSKKNVTFKAFMTNYNEQFNTSYDEQFFVMNQQPVRKLKSTVRTISLGWSLPARNEAEAHINMGKVSLLSNMLYPEQERSSGGWYPKVGGSPIFKLRLLNFIRHPSPSGVESYSTAHKSGMLGYISDFAYNFTFDEGFFLGGGKALPKNIELSMVYYPVHEKSPAWIDGQFNYPSYPYKEGWGLHLAPGAAQLGSEYAGTIVDQSRESKILEDKPEAHDTPPEMTSEYIPAPRARFLRHPVGDQPGLGGAGAFAQAEAETRKKL